MGAEIFEDKRTNSRCVFCLHGQTNYTLRWALNSKKTHRSISMPLCRKCYAELKGAIYGLEAMRTEERA